MEMKHFQTFATKKMGPKGFEPSTNGILRTTSYKTIAPPG